MRATVRATNDPARVLREAGAFLTSDPVRHNVILTLLRARVAHPEPGRYWVIDVDGEIAGVVFQSPLDHFAAVTPMTTDVMTEAVVRIADEGVRLPGIDGDAATAARFAGAWTECTRSAAVPVLGERIYEVDTVLPARSAVGALRLALVGDFDRVAQLMREFALEIAEVEGDEDEHTRQRLDAGQLWVWDDQEIVAVAGLSKPAAGAVRIGPVYTSVDRRTRGYATALVAAISARARADGLRCILYTDLGNAGSNSIYRAIGYVAVAEGIRYRFEPSS